MLLRSANDVCSSNIGQSACAFTGLHAGWTSSLQILVVFTTSVVSASFFKSRDLSIFLPLTKRCHSEPHTKTETLQTQDQDQ